MVTRNEATRLLSREFPTANLASAGTPDLVLARDNEIALVECKRLPGKYWDNDCMRSEGAIACSRHSRTGQGLQGKPASPTRQF